MKRESSYGHPTYGQILGHERNRRPSLWKTDNEFECRIDGLKEFEAETFALCLVPFRLLIVR
jgi:hypothetical protein